MTEKTLKSATIQLSTDTRPLSAADTTFTDAAHPATVIEPESVEYNGFLCTLRGVIKEPTQSLARIGLVTPDHPISATCYEAVLQPDGFATMELAMGVRLIQPGI